MGETGVYLLAGLLVINVLTFALFGWDKLKSKGRRSRVSERRLLAQAALGGFPGAKLGQHFFRHKTVKQPFARRLNAIGWVWALLVLGSVGYWLVAGSWG